MNDFTVTILKRIKDSMNISDYFSNAIKNTEIALSGMLKSLEPIMKKIEENSKILAKKSIELGFYPSNSFNLYEYDFIDLKTKKEKIDYISNKIKNLLTEDYINEISTYLRKGKIINIYDDYLKKDYESAILKLIVIINVIFNDKLTGISSEQVHDIKRVCNNIVTGVELPDKKTRSLRKDIDWESIEAIHRSDGFEKHAYYLFAPYYYTEKDNNPLFKNWRKNNMTNEEIKKEYKKIPYNRNAIIHGYVENYGNELNCLRWFSVLINTYELFKLLEELSISE